MTGKVSLVGAGPGDPELLTVKAARSIESADAVVYDRLVSDAIMALVPRGVPRFFAGKSCKQKAMTQDEINALLIALAQQGKNVVRLKGGDPLLFGRGGEEALELRKQNIPFEIVPGITSAQGCAAYAGIPLTHRTLATGVRYLTGHTLVPSPACGGGLGRGSQPDKSPPVIHPLPGPPPQAGEGEVNLNWQSLADPDTTLVVYMGLANLGLIAQRLVEYGLPATTPAAAIAHGTTPDQQLVLSDLAHIRQATLAAKLESPTLVIIGKVAALAADLQWFIPQAVENTVDYTDNVTQLSY